MQNDNIWLIAGLGNPGGKYERTWHNMGFMVLEYLSQKYNIKITKIKFKGIYGQGEINGQKVILLKPATFMNNSGESVREAVSFFKIPEERTLLIYDDIDIDIGNIRIRPQGSAGTHNGMRSVITHLNTSAFPRIRIGIGPMPDNWQIVDYVLSEIPDIQKETVFEAIKTSVQVIEDLLGKGIMKSISLKKNIKEQTNDKSKE